LLFTVISVVHAQSDLPDRYVFSIVQNDPSVETKVNAFRCYCTVIAPKFVVIPATCADVQSPFVLEIFIAFGFGPGTEASKIGRKLGQENRP
jgi:hypothetical protein